jgi:hypothetical protein
MNPHHGIAIILLALLVGALVAIRTPALASSPEAKRHMAADERPALQTSPTASGTHFVRIPAKAFDKAADLALRPSSRLEYGSFNWMELRPAAFARLQASGVAFEERPDPFTLRLGEQSFDPARGVPLLPPGWDTVRADGPDFRLVQFAGPSRAEWLANLEDSGLEIVQYIHPFTYIVYGRADALETVASNSAIRWAGPFAPAYRVLPQWRNLPDHSHDVTVLLYRGADADAAVQAIEDLGGRLDRRAVLNHVFEVAGFEMSGGLLQAAAQVPGVYSIKPVPTDGGLRGEMSDQVCANNVDENNLAFPGYLSWLAEVGVDGNGVIMANVDGGVQNNHPDLIDRLIACTGQTCGGGATSGHGTHTAGIMAADGSSGVLDSYGFLRGLGIAPGANLVEQVYSPYFTWPDGMLLLMTESYANGASLSGNSWGPSGSPQGYDDDTMQVDIGSRDTDPDTPGDQPLLFVLSIMNGNGGTSSQGTPDEAKNIFTIGSTKMQNSNGSQILDIDDLSSNSAHGPCLDGRKIPHLVAPGCRVDSSWSGSGYSLACGTSMASPHVSGAAGLFIEYYRNLPDYTADPSPAMIKAAFLPVAHDLAGNQDADGGTMGHPFDNKQGWGRMDLPAVVDPQVEVRYFDNPVILDNTGEEWSEDISAADPTKPIRVMLVWTDAPGHGLGGSTPAWNNDLDLVVESLTETYLGNNFGSEGWSELGGSADDRNNTEGVFIGPTASGVYNIRVVASNINSDGLPNSGDSTDQDFAVACYNCGPGGPQPPNANDAEASTDMNTPVMITLQADDDGLPEPATLDYIITALPANGTLTDPGAGTILSVPHTLVGLGNQVEYTPDAWYFGSDAFQFKANDSGVPPEGGDSNVAGVSITVNLPPQTAHSFAMDSDPGWTTQGQWAFGEPAAGGSFDGDPSSAYTGNNVYGFNIGGDYENNMAVYYLTTSAIDCSGLNDTKLRFRRWLGVEARPFDHASAEVSNNGTDWTLLWRHPADTISESSWSLQTYDTSAVADDQPTVYIRWSMGPTNDSVTYPGWSIDDVEILTTMEPCVTAAGDVNLDGTINGGDIRAFVNVLIDPGSSTIQQQCAADLFVDAVVDLQDVGPFIQTLLSVAP